MHSWFPLARLAQHTGAYTALFTFAVTVKNNLLILIKHFDAANGVFPHMCMSNVATLTNNSHNSTGLAKSDHPHSPRALWQVLLITLEHMPVKTFLREDNDERSCHRYKNKRLQKVQFLITTTMRIEILKKIFLFNKPLAKATLIGIKGFKMKSEGTAELSPIVTWARKRALPCLDCGNEFSAARLKVGP
jgi:hypothetical protein